MRVSWLECVSCQTRFDVAPLFFGCPICEERGKKRPLEMKYAAETPAYDATQSGVWRWPGLLPEVDQTHRLSLCEGGTGLLPVRAMGMKATVLLKNESTNPTWSWKDRPNAVSVSVARHFGFRRVVAKSTGNHGNSMAAYAAAGGMTSTVLCNAGTPRLQLALMEGYGATVVQDSRQDEMLPDMICNQGYFPCTILCPQSGFSNPFGVEGFKTIAFEIVQALGGRAPDRVFVGTGSGDGVYGIWKGFRELCERGMLPTAPRMVACQAEGANSAARAWRAGNRHVEPLSSVNTVALSVAELATGDHALRAVQQSSGSVMEAPDELILEAARQLQRMGIALEPASALPLACAQTLADGEGEVWVLIGSGSAVKWPDTILSETSKRARVNPNPA